MQLTDLAKAGRLRLALAPLEHAHRAEILAAIDSLTRPLTAREIERALSAHGGTRRHAGALAGGLKDFRIVIIDNTATEGGRHDQQHNPAG
jgi:hypothetical protein